MSRKSPSDQKPPAAMGGRKLGTFTYEELEGCANSFFRGAMFIPMVVAMKMVQPRRPLSTVFGDILNDDKEHIGGSRAQTIAWKAPYWIAAGAGIIYEATKVTSAALGF